MKMIGPFEKSQMNAITFGTNLIFNAACSETIKALDELSVESITLLHGIQEADTLEKKTTNRAALKHNFQDRKFLLDTLFMNPIEKDV